MDLCSRVLQVMIAATLLILPATSESCDWFVRAVNMGEDGSQERPFVDPWQALDKLEAGNKVHVTEGKYYGKVVAGTKREQPLARKRQEELAKMFENFYCTTDYHQVRQGFVFNQAVSEIPRNIARHKLADRRT